MTDEYNTYRMLISELEEYEQAGIRLLINGTDASPLMIAEAEYVAEDTSNYMRDYIFTEEGRIKEIHFDLVTQYA